MKKSIFFCATVAISCGGIATAQAQVQLLRNQPTPAPRLVAAQSGTAEVDGQFSPLQFDPQTSYETRNPFEFGVGNSSNVNASPADVSGPAENDPTSLPVGRHHRRGVVDTIVDYSVVSHLSSAPLDWCVGAATPNPVADILLRQECVTGLWDSYPQQRAAECAAMWAKINGHGGRCGGCGVSGPCTACRPVASCGRPVRNRYLAQPSTACDVAGCTDCASNANPTRPTAIPVSAATPQTKSSSTASLQPARVR